MRPLVPALPLCLALLLPALPAGADAAGPQGLDTADQARGWEGVGKLLLGERGFCTGALVGADLVLTAAHCLFDHDTGARLPDPQITFQAGWRNGRAEAYRKVRRSVADPDYIYAGEDDLDRVGHDLALLQLDRPILLPQLPPFATADRPASGAEVSVVSYAQDRSGIPSIERGCRVLADEGKALVLNCDIDFGSSGSPVFSLEAGGARVVSVISAKAELDGRKVALAVPVEPAIAALREELAQAETRRPGVSGVRILSGGEAGGEGGAKFLAP